MINNLEFLKALYHQFIRRTGVHYNDNLQSYISLAKYFFMSEQANTTLVYHWVL